MKKKFILWLLVLAFLLPLFSQAGVAANEPYVTPINAHEPLRIARGESGVLPMRYDTGSTARGFLASFYRVSLTGNETQEQLQEKARELIEAETKPYKTESDLGNAPVRIDVDIEINGNEFEVGTYLLVAYLYDFDYREFPVPIHKEPLFDCMYVTPLTVVSTPVACSGTVFTVSDAAGTITPAATELEIEMGAQVYLDIQMNPADATAMFFCWLFEEDFNGNYNVDNFDLQSAGDDRLLLTAKRCGQSRLRVKWTSGANKASPSSYLTVTTPCALCEEIAEVIQERTATQPGKLSGPCIGCGFPITQTWSPIFTDTYPNEYYAPAVDYCYEQQLFRGTSEDKFSPNMAMSRGMVVTVLYRLAGSPSTSGLKNEFTDVAEGQYYADPIKWATANGIVNGMGGGKYQPNTNVTREQLAAILYRYAQFTGMDMTVTGDGLAKFTDRNTVSDYALTPMVWAVDRGLINGVTTTTLQPRGNALRAQVAAIIYRYVLSVANPA